MTAQTQTASPAQAPKAKAKVVLAALSPDVAKDAAFATAKAVVTCEKAKRTLLTSVAEAVALVGMALNAAQYDRQFKPYLAEGFAKAVKRGDISQKTADQYASKLKTAVLAILSGAATPIAGETFWEFYDRATPLLVSATLANGSPVWEASAKRGRKVGARQPAKPGGGALPGHIAQANRDGSAADSAGDGFNRSPKTAAALILTGNNEARAQRLLIVLQSYAEQFDRFAETVLTDADKAELAKRSTAATAERVLASKPLTLKADQPATALADQLVKAQAKANAKAA